MNNNNNNNNIKAQIQIMIKKEQKKLHHHLQLQDLGKMLDIDKLKLKEQYAIHTVDGTSWNHLIHSSTASFLI